MLKVFPNLDQAERETALEFAERRQDSPRKATRQRARRVLGLR